MYTISSIWNQWEVKNYLCSRIHITIIAYRVAYLHCEFPSNEQNGFFVSFHVLHVHFLSFYTVFFFSFVGMWKLALTIYNCNFQLLRDEKQILDFSFKRYECNNNLLFAENRQNQRFSIQPNVMRMERKKENVKFLRVSVESVESEDSLVSLLEILLGLIGMKRAYKRKCKFAKHKTNRNIQSNQMVRRTFENVNDVISNRKHFHNRKTSLLIRSPTFQRFEEIVEWLHQPYPNSLNTYRNNILNG